MVNCKCLLLRICGIFLFSLILTSCGTTEDAQSVAETSESTQSVGTSGQLIPIVSDNVRAAGYDATSMIMTVQFNNGHVYEYYGVSSDLWDSFIAAQPHPWSLVGYPQLVQAGVPYKRIS